MKKRKENYIKLSTLATCIAVGMCSTNAIAAPTWNGETHTGGETPMDAMFGSALVQATFYVGEAPDLGPEYPDPKELFAESGTLHPFLQWCPGVIVPDSPDYVPEITGDLIYDIPWKYQSGSASGYSCEDEYLRIHGDNGGSDVEETNVLVLDPASLETNEINQFDATGGAMDGNPGTTEDSLALTSARALKQLANTYVRQEGSAQKVSAYITDWSQYDARLVNESADGNGDGKVTVNETGRGFNLEKMIENPTMFDTLIFSFMGICGDTSTNVGSLLEHCTGGSNGGTDSLNGEVSLVDHWGDMASSVNTGTAGATDITPANWKSYIGNQNVGGVLGGMFAIQDAAAEQGHVVELAMSIGGWSMSGYFSEVAASEELRENFVNSVVEYASAWNTEDKKRFHRIDIDWEYPGFGPEGSSCETCDEDGENYVTLLSELREALNNNPLTAHMKITLATVGVPSKMEEMLPVFAADIADDYFVMTYDYFGTGWAEQLDHHANLYDGEFSADSAIQYMKEQGVPAEKIHIGYAGYGRAGAGVTDFASKQYDKTHESLGGFENGAPELADIMFNWLDLGDEPDAPKGKNDFKLITDINAKAQVLVNETTGNFISVETPLTVREKAEYARAKGLGGIFSWAGDQENGMLANASHEGLGHTLHEGPVWDMAQSYGCGTVIANWGEGDNFVELNDTESNAVCQGVFDDNFSQYTKVDSVSGGSFGDAKVGDYLQLKIKKADETLAISQHLVTSDYHIAGSHRKAIYSSNAMNRVLNNLDHYAQFKVGERNSSGAINTISSSYRNALYCGYGCENVSIEESVVSSTYTQIGQLNGYDVKPESLITLDILNQDGSVYASTSYTPTEYMSVGFRWPDELCSILDHDSENKLECGELKGLDDFEVINSSVYRNYIWSKDPNQTIRIQVASPAED